MSLSPQVRIIILLLFIVVIGAVILVVLTGQNTPVEDTTPTEEPVVDEDTENGDTDDGDAADDGEEQVQATPVQFVQVIVAVQQIPRGMIIPRNALDIRLWPEEWAPSNAIIVGQGREQEGYDRIVGNIARTDITIEQPILENMLVQDLTGIAESGSDIAAVLPNNRVAIAVPIDRLTSVAYAVQPGDYVDVIVSLLYVDIDTDFQSKEPNEFFPYNVTLNDDGTVTYSPAGQSIPGNITTRPGAQGDTIVGIVSPSEPQRPRLVTQRTVQNALVVWLGEVPQGGKVYTVPTPTPLPTATPEPDAEEADGAPPPPTNTPVPPRPDLIVLGVSPQDSVTLTWFIEAGLPITFALRSATTTSQAITEDVSLDYIMDSFSIELPGKRPYSIEPAITSIRELFVGERIELRQE